MGKRFLRSIVSDFQTLTASADITPVDLPVNPISHLVLTLEGTGSDGTTAGNYSYLDDFVTGVTECSVRHRGENIIQGSLRDLMVMNAFLSGYYPWGEKPDDDVGKVRSMSFLLSFSRQPYWHDEAFPATMRGNLRFHMTAGALPTGFSARRWALEAVELIDDTPKQFLKYTTLTRALSATGRQRVALPIGNPMLALMLFDPTAVTTDAADYAFQKVKLFKDSVEQYYVESNWESLHDYAGRRGVQPFNLGGHIHELDDVTLVAVSEEQIMNSGQGARSYAFLDFDPLKDGSYALETAGAAQLDLDMNSDVSSGTVRLMPLELVAVPG